LALGDAEGRLARSTSFGSFAGAAVSAAATGSAGGAAFGFAAGATVVVTAGGEGGESAVGAELDDWSMITAAAAAANNPPTPAIQTRELPFPSSAFEAARAGAAAGAFRDDAGAVADDRELAAAAGATDEAGGTFSFAEEGDDADAWSSSSKSAADASFVSFARSPASGSTWAIIFRSTIPESPGSDRRVAAAAAAKDDTDTGAALLGGGVGVSEGEFASLARSFRLRRSRPLSGG
jgi:hypothetical protein